jgi:Rne/Rng family ribonuclease
LLSDLLIAAGPGEWRAALLEDGTPVELFVERGDRNEAGSIHLGRVSRLLPALSAMLVDIGGDRPAFLPEREVFPRGRRLDEGERVVVQVRREAQGGKAARVTTGVTLCGRLAELRPGRPGVVGGGGEELSPEERTQLLSVIAAGREGLSRGTATGLKLLEPAPIEIVAAEATDLLRRWRDILDRASRIAPPARLDPRATFAAALASALPALPAPPVRILTDDPAAIAELRAVFPGAVVIHRPEAEWPIEIDALFDRALSGTVALDGGGSIHVEGTRAAVLIDVDSGTPETGSPERTGLAANLAAADAIAREIRLRNLGGGIVIDFVGLDGRALRGRVRDALARALARDPAHPQLLGWTRLGHLELVRPRRGRPLAEALLEQAADRGPIKTAITVGYEALRALRREARAQPGCRWRLIVAPDVAAALGGGVASAFGVLEERFGRRIAIETDPGLDRDRFQITPL